MLAKSFSEDTEDNRNIVLEVLEVLPDLMTEDKIVIEDEIRQGFIEFAMEHLQPGVLKTLSDASLHSKLPSRRRYQLINCFQAWLIDQTRDEVKLHLHQLNLINFCLAELKLDGENNEEASDAIIGCMVICKDSVKYQALYEAIIGGLFEGKQQFELFVQQSMEEEVRPYIAAYSVLVIRIFDQILQEPQNDHIKFMLQGVFLRALQQPKREIVIKAVSAINSIVKKLIHEGSTSQARADQTTNFLSIYSGWFDSILEACCVHSILSVVKYVIMQEQLNFYQTRNMDSDTDDNLEDKNALRQDIYYLVYKISKLISFSSVFKVIGSRISTSIQLLQSEGEQPTPNSIAKFEAELYCLSGALKSVPTDNPAVFEHMQKVLELTLSFNYPKDKILFTALKVLSKCSLFFGNRIDLLQSAFKFLANCVSNKKFEDEAAEAISNLCRNNKSFVIENLNDFVDCKVSFI